MTLKVPEAVLHIFKRSGRLVDLGGRVQAFETLHHVAKLFAGNANFANGGCGRIRRQGFALVADFDKEGPAAKAGITSGDIIISFNGKELREMDAMPILFAQTEIGSTVDARELRSGKEKTIAVKIAELKDAKFHDLTWR